ncbi:MAG: DUF561 domain-containing protein [Candidatus Gastranaerophilaceae bacterium]|jgi:isopentenyl diphosphate isomerase/L-lactate dehydrogenase-like FMN-dependent dehydrogenase
MNRIETFKKALNEKRAVKIIAGINNFDSEKVKKVVCAADQAGADAVDIAADVNLINMSKELTNLPIFVSSIKPEELAMATQNGADAIEIGNYDALYADGLRLSADDILEITRRTRELAGNDIFLSVTIPGHLEVEEQIRLACALKAFNVDLLQSEGAAIANVTNNGARGLLEKANVSIANTIELKRNVEIPVMTASGITSTTVSLVFASGADAVGIGSCVNKLNSTVEMIAAIKNILGNINLQSRTRELV